MIGWVHIFLIAIRRLVLDELGSRGVGISAANLHVGQALQVLVRGIPFRSAEDHADAAPPTCAKGSAHVESAIARLLIGDPNSPEHVAS